MEAEAVTWQSIVPGRAWRYGLDWRIVKTLAQDQWVLQCRGQFGFKDVRYINAPLDEAKRIAEVIVKLRGHKP